MAEISVGVEVTFQVQMLQKRLISSTQKLIEDMKVPLIRILMHNARLLQQVVQDVAAIRNALP
jgi:hypothetical protein